VVGKAPWLFATLVALVFLPCVGTPLLAEVTVTLMACRLYDGVVAPPLSCRNGVDDHVQQGSLGSENLRQCLFIGFLYSTALPTYCLCVKHSVQLAKMAERNEEDDFEVDVSSDDESSEESETEDESEYEDEDDEDGGVKGLVKAAYLNTVGVFADPLNLFSDKEEHSVQIKSRQQNRARVKKYFGIGGNIAWAASVTMVVVVFPILIVAQRDNMIKELREQQQRAAAAGGGIPGLPMQM